MKNHKLYAMVEKVLPLLAGWCSPEKARKFVEIILREKPSLCVEIGVFGGSSLIPQALAIQHLGRGKVFGIDPWTVDAAREEMQDVANLEWWTKYVNLEEIHQQCKHHLSALGLTDCCELVRAKAEDVVDQFGVGTVGLLHIDGNHSQALSMMDATLYLPKVASGGHIFFDDVSWTENAVATTHQALTYLLRHGCNQVDQTGDCVILRKQVERAGQ